MIEILPIGFALRETKGEVPEVEWLNYSIKVTVTWYDQVVFEMLVQHI